LQEFRLAKGLQTQQYFEQVHMGVNTSWLLQSQLVDAFQLKSVMVQGACCGSKVS
jgi:hypothetical protein